MQEHHPQTAHPLFVQYYIHFICTARLHYASVFVVVVIQVADTRRRFDRGNCIALPGKARARRAKPASIESRCLEIGVKN